MICLHKLIERLQRKRELNTEFGFVPQKRGLPKENNVIKDTKIEFSLRSNASNISCRQSTC